MPQHSKLQTASKLQKEAETHYFRARIYTANLIELQKHCGWLDFSVEQSILKARASLEQALGAYKTLALHHLMGWE